MGGAAIPLSAGLTGPSAKAAPWIEPGDVTLRSDIEVLARYGIIPNLTTTWPLPWAQIADGINAAAGQELPNYVRLAVDRVRARMPRNGRGFEQHVEGEVRYTNKPSVVRDFTEQNRQKLYGQLSTDLQLGSSTYAKLSIGYEGDQHHGVALPDDTYIAQNIGNWTVYGGYVPRWWGAGWDTSLFLSTNAREMPSFGITRQNPKPFGTKLLSWLGPWTFDFYVGRVQRSALYRKHRADQYALRLQPAEESGDRSVAGDHDLRLGPSLQCLEPLQILHRRQRASNEPAAQRRT